MNHRYNTPEKGSNDWHIPLNKNFETLDRDIEIRDSDENINDYEPKPNAKFFATDTGNIYLGDGSQWTRIGRTSSEVYVATYPGADLATKITNALVDLPSGGGRVIVTPQSDGTHWTWGPNLTLNPNDYRGLHLDIAQGTGIEYRGDGYALTLDTGGEVGQQSAKGSFVTITGGRWIATGSDPAGGIQLKDCYRTILQPSHMQNWRNSTGDTACISVENHNTWSEDTKIRDVRFDGDIGIDFKSSRITDGSGTLSFVNTHVENCTFNCDGPGLNLRGAFNNSVFINNEWFVRRQGQDLVFLEGHADSSLFICPRFDNIEHYSDVTPFHFGPNYMNDTGPMILQPRFNNISNRSLDESGNNIRTPLLNGRNGTRIGLLGRDSYFEIQDSQFNWVLNGTRVANLNGYGDLTLSGSLTEDGSP